jgi:lantibiotic leader peptide-processing serine protease
VAVARTDSDDFQTAAAEIPGVRSVVPNLELDWLPPEIGMVGETNPPSSGDDDNGFQLQWPLDAIDAPEAWNAGYRGAGVRVAVLDNGIASASPDLAPNLNAALSTSFVAGEAYNTILWPGPFHHGTYVAGIIAAADDTRGIIGVAPSAEIVAVKVLDTRAERGHGTLEDVVEGIVYAANIKADVINMSFGARLSQRGYWSGLGTPDPSEDVFVSARDVSETRNLYARATTYAYEQGATLVASAGNDAINFDRTADLLVLPAMSPHVLAVSATAPEGWCLNPSTDLDIKASYTNLGQSLIDFAAPGGDADFPNPTSATCTFMISGVGRITQRVETFDRVLSVGVPPRQVVHSTGTSAAASHVSGVAALIVGKNGGSLPPAEVVQVLRGSADDLGRAGDDEIYGAGRVNAFQAVR